MQQELNIILKWQSFENALKLCNNANQKLALICSFLVKEMKANNAWCMLAPSETTEHNEQPIVVKAHTKTRALKALLSQPETIDLFKSQTASTGIPFPYQNQALQNISPAHTIMVCAVPWGFYARLYIGLHSPFRQADNSALLKALYQSLSHLENKITDILDLVDDAAVIVDNNGVLSYCNAALCQLTDYTPKELNHKSIQTIFCPQEHDKLIQREKIRAQGAPHPNFYKTTLVDKQKQRISVELIRQEIRHKDKPKVLLFFKPLSPTLPLSEKTVSYYQRLAEETFDGIIIHKNGTIVETNSTFANMVDMTVAEIIGQSIVNFVNPKDIDRFKQILSQEGEQSYRLKGFKKDKKTPLYAEVQSKAISYKGEAMRIATIRDISEKITSLEQLEDTVQELYEAQEIGRTGSWKYLIDKRQFQMSPYTQQMMNFETQNAKVEQVLSRLHHNEKEALVKKFKSLFNTPQKELHTRLKIQKNKSNDWCLFDASLSYVSDKNYIAGILKDITEEEKNREELQASEARFRTLFNSINDAVFVHPYNKNGFEHFIEVNDIACQRYGYSREAFLTMNAEDITPAEALEEYYKHSYRQDLHDRHWNIVETVHQTKAGKRIPVEVTSRLFNFNNKTMIMSLAQDISERKKYIDTIKQSEKNLKSYILKAPFGIFITDHIGTVTSTNPTAENLTGLSKHQLVNLCIFSLFTPSCREKIEHHFEGIIHNKDSFEVNAEVLLHDGTSRTWHIIYSHTGHDTYVAYVNDITQHLIDGKKIQDLLDKQRKINAQLLREKERAEESDRLKSAFLANMSHEIRTPMNGILGFSDLLSRPDLSPQQQNQYIDIIQKSGHRMLSTINDLIDISKIEAGLTTIKATDFDIVPFFDSIEAFFTAEAKKKNLKLTFNKANKLISYTCHTDQQKLHAIVSNLVKNALKFTHEGEVSLHYEILKENLIIRIKDTGIGIPEHRQKAVWDHFIQADIEDKNAYEGSGLGLAIAKSYCEMLGGHISLKSIEHVGSTFYVTLPVNNRD